MNEFDYSSQDTERKLRAIRRPAPPDPSTRWRAILGNGGMFLGAALALVYLFSGGDTGGRGFAKLIIFIGVIVGGAFGFILGLVIDGVVTATQRSAYDASWDDRDAGSDERGD